MTNFVDTSSELNPLKSFYSFIRLFIYIHTTGSSGCPELYQIRPKAALISAFMILIPKIPQIFIIIPSSRIIAHLPRWLVSVSKTSANWGALRHVDFLQFDCLMFVIRMKKIKLGFLPHKEVDLDTKK